MKTAILLASLATLGLLANAAFAETDCVKLAVSVGHAVEAKPDAVLEIVEERVAVHEDCACEIVKAAIIAAKANASEVAAIVETAAGVAPEQMRLIAQCAVAVAPDALSEVQAVMIRLDPGQGESPVLSAKSPKEVLPDSTAPDVMPEWNPLNFPGEGIGPNPGGPGGTPLFPPIPPIPPLPPQDPFIPDTPATPTDLQDNF